MARQTDQIVSGYPILAEEQYIKKHYNSVDFSKYQLSAQFF